MLESNVDGFDINLRRVPAPHGELLRVVMQAQQTRVQVESTVYHFQQSNFETVQARVKLAPPYLGDEDAHPRQVEAPLATEL